jgi:hypothetical protein
MQTSFEDLSARPNVDYVLMFLDADDDCCTRLRQVHDFGEARQVPDTAFLAGASEMSERIRLHNWGTNTVWNFV